MTLLSQHVTDYFSAGGPVMIPILLSSFVMWTLILNRLFFIRRLTLNDISKDTAKKLVRDKSLPESHFCGIATQLVTDFHLNRSSNSDLNISILDESMMRLASSLNRYLDTIKFLTAVTPLLGLLGTVTGMITTFDVIALYGTGNVKALSNGISEALITTQTGLFVSIPGLFLSGFLLRKTSRLKMHIIEMGMVLKQYV